MAVNFKNRKKAKNITRVSLAVFILLFSIGSMMFVKNVYDRKFPRFDKPDFSGYLRYSDVDGYDRRVVEFKSGKNTLAGYIYGGGNRKGLVVISSGLGNGAENYLAETLYFTDHGWCVFSFDNTGTHESEGKSTVGLPQSLIDLDAALTYIKSNNTLRDLPVMLYGHSWGGYAVTAILNYSCNINAAVSISGFSSPNELMFETSKKTMGLFAYIEYPFEWLYQTMLFGGTARVTAVEGINRTDTPVMIIHGDEDEEISYYGASIIAHQVQITNPNVIFKTCSTPDHNGHNNLLKSEASSEYIKVKNEEYKKLYDRYNGNIPNDIRSEYYEAVDKFQTSELNVDLMNEINNYFEGSLSN